MRDYVLTHSRYPNDLIGSTLPEEILNYPDFFINNYDSLQEDYDNLLRVKNAEEIYEVKSYSYKKTLLVENPLLEIENEINQLQQQKEELVKDMSTVKGKLSLFETLNQRREYVDKVEGIENVKKQIKYLKLEENKKKKKLTLKKYPKLNLETKYPIIKNAFQCLEPEDDFYFGDDFEIFDNEFETDMRVVQNEHLKIENEKSQKNIILEDYMKAFNLLVQVKNPERIFTNCGVLNKNLSEIKKGNKTCGDNKIPRRVGRNYFSLIAKFYSLIRRGKFVKNIDKSIHKVRGCTIKFAMSSLLSIRDQIDLNLLSPNKINKFLIQ